MSADARISQATLDEAVAGDPAAIGLLWKTWNPPLLRFLRSRKVKDYDDLASTIWVDIASGLPRFVGDPSAFRRWLFTMAHRRIIDNARAIARQPATTRLRATPAAATTNAFAVAGSAEWAIALLQHLPEDQAAAIALRILADLSAAEAAEILGVSEGNIRVLTHRGLRKLRERLVSNDLGEPGADQDGKIRKSIENASNVVTLEAFRSLTPDA